MCLRTRGIVRLISYFTALALVLSGFLYRAAEEKQALLETRRREARRAYQEMLASLEEMDAALLKFSASSSPAMLASLAFDVRRTAEAAGTRFAELPGAGVDAEKTAAFLNRTADYASSLAASASRGSLPEKEEREAAAALRACLGEILGSFSESAAYIYEEAFFDDPPSGGEKPDGEGVSFAQSVSSLGSAFPETPTLSYDGKWSEGQDERELAAKALPAVSADEAREAMAALFGVPREKIVPEGKSGDRLPAYVFRFPAGNGTGEIRAAVSENGGMLLALSAEAVPGKSGAGLTAGKAVEAGRAFLKKAGFGNVEADGYRRDGEILYIEYAAEEGGVRFYPDAVRLGVSLADGTPVFLDASGYLENHRERELPESFGGAYEMPALAEGIRGVEAKPALIASEGKREIPCYEIRATDREGNAFLLYLNAESGEEERLLVLTEGEDCLRAG